MKNTNNIFPLLILFLAFAYSCSYTKVENEAPAITTLKKGTKFRICLEEDHRLGESWQLQKDSQTDAFEELGNVWHGNNKGLEINLKALISGNYTITVFKRSYQDTVQTKRYLFTIIDN